MVTKRPTTAVDLGAMVSEGAKTGTGGPAAGREACTSRSSGDTPLLEGRESRIYGPNILDPISTRAALRMLKR